MIGSQVKRNSRQFYSGLMDYVYSEFDDYRTSREMEHSWQTYFTGDSSIKGTTFAKVNRWQEKALAAPCKVGSLISAPHAPPAGGLSKM